MITKTTTVDEAQTHLPELLTLALEGVEVIIVEDGKLLARLVPIAASGKKPKKERVAGLNRGQIWVSEDFDDPLPDGFWTGSE